MTMQFDQLIGAPVTGSDGQSVGTVEQVFRDDIDGTPSWARIRSGEGERFVPLAGSQLTTSGLNVPFESQTIVNEPYIAVDKHMSVDQEEELRHYFGLTVPAQGGPTEPGEMGPGGLQTGEPMQDTMSQSQAGLMEEGQPPMGTAGETMAQPGTISDTTGQDWLIRSEERLAIGTELVESGRVRLHKYIESEPVEQTVRVFHEEYQIERMPISADERISGAMTEDEQEIILHEEHAIISRDAVPVERIRLSARKVEEDKTVTGELRREQIEVLSDKDLGSGYVESG